jgi:hypothetical protein
MFDSTDIEIHEWNSFRIGEELRSDFGENMMKE